MPHAREVVEVLQTLLRTLRTVGQHAVARTERNLAADDLVLRIVVAANLDLVDDDRNALFDDEDEVELVLRVVTAG